MNPALPSSRRRFSLIIIDNENYHFDNDKCLTDKDKCRYGQWKLLLWIMTNVITKGIVMNNYKCRYDNDKNYYFLNVVLTSKNPTT